MPEGDRPHAALRWVTRVAVALVVLVFVGGLGHRFVVLDQPDPRQDPAAVEPPAGLDLPTPAPPAPVATAERLTPPDPAAVRQALRGLLADPRLGRRVSVAVAGVDGRPVLAEGPAVVTPASTLKLLTCLAALEALGPEHRFSTTVVASDQTVTLVGGGDPLLAREPVDEDTYPAQADVVTLARQVAEALSDDGIRRIRLQYDATLFTGPVASPGWEADYLPDDVVSPISALWVDGGRVELGEEERSDDPAAAAADAFATELRRRGLTVLGEPTPGIARPDATQVAAVQGAELVEVVQHVLEVSDNEAAEVLARHTALAEGLPGSFAGAEEAVGAVLDRLGVPLRGAVLLDGSGLARGNQLALTTMLETLAAGAGDPELAALTEGLPVAGFNGSLGDRFATDAEAGLGWVRAKTGTLTGVHGLAGIVTGRDGTVMLFVAAADRVKVENTLFARDRLDQVAAALAGCACAR